jgi:hypothetical protein
MELFREARHAPPGVLRNGCGHILNVVEEDINIAHRTTKIIIVSAAEVLVGGLIEHQLPSVTPTDPPTLVECLIDDRHTSQKVGELVVSTIAESLLDRDGAEAHDHFRPRRTVRMRPKMARTKVKSQNFRMIASL